MCKLVTGLLIKKCQLNSGRDTSSKKPQTLSAKSLSLSQSSKTPRSSFVNLFPLSWSHYTVLSRIKNSNERSFYEIESLQGNWSVRELQRQYDG